MSSNEARKQKLAKGWKTVSIMAPPEVLADLAFLQEQMSTLGKRPPSQGEVLARLISGVAGDIRTKLKGNLMPTHELPHEDGVATPQAALVLGSGGVHEAAHECSCSAEARLAHLEGRLSAVENAIAAGVHPGQGCGF